MFIFLLIKLSHSCVLILSELYLHDPLCQAAMAGGEKRNRKKTAGNSRSSDITHVPAIVSAPSSPLQPSLADTEELEHVTEAERAENR